MLFIGMMQQDASTQSMSTTCTCPTFPTGLVTDTEEAEQVLVVILPFPQIFVEESGSGLALSLTCNFLAEYLRENASVQNCVPSSSEHIQHNKHARQATHTHMFLRKVLIAFLSGSSRDCQLEFVLQSYSVRFQLRLSAKSCS